MIQPKKTASVELAEMYAKWKQDGGETKRPEVKEIPKKFNQLPKWVVKPETKIKHRSET